MSILFMNDLKIQDQAAKNKAFNLTVNLLVFPIIWGNFITKLLSLQERFVQQRRGIPNVVERAVGAAL